MKTSASTSAAPGSHGVQIIMQSSDRDYRRIRHVAGRRAGRRGLGIRAWSVSTWLIVICIGVFFVDQILPGSWYAPVMTSTTPEGLKFDADAVVYDQPMIWFDSLGKPQFAQQAVYESTPFGPKRIGVIGTIYLAPISYALHYSTLKGFLGFEYWRFIGFQFLHGNLLHLIFNMIGLFIFGPIVEEALGRKRYLAFYLICGIFGALLFSLLNLLGYIATSRGVAVEIPGLLFEFPSMPLIGASASVFGVVVAGAFLEPRAIVWVLIFPVRLPILAAFGVLVALMVVLTGGSNAGGQASHLGGAMAGGYFIKHQHHLHGFFDILSYVDPTSHHYRDKKRGRRTPPPTQPPRDRVAAILRKIDEQGLSSLTPEERRILNESTRDR